MGGGGGTPPADLGGGGTGPCAAAAGGAGALDCVTGIAFGGAGFTGAGGDFGCEDCAGAEGPDKKLAGEGVDITTGAGAATGFAWGFGTAGFGGALGSFRCGWAP